MWWWSVGRPTLLRLLATGHRTADIAEALSLPAATVRRVIREMCQQAGVADRTALVAHAYRTGRLS